MSETAIGVDIGGTKIKFALVEEDGHVLIEETLPTEAAKGASQVLDKVMKGIDSILAKCDSFGGMSPLRGIGIGTAGQVDFSTGTVVFAVDTLPGWTGTRIKSLVEQRFGLPVWVDNDVNVLAVAEGRYGKHRYENYITLALGTGIGGAIVVAGSLVRGSYGGAGELGHVSVNYQGPRCSCGNYGCLELYSSGSGIARIARERIAEGRWSSALKPDAKNIIHAWKSGDPFAAELIHESLEALGTAIAGYIHIFNPEAILIGGGMSAAGEVFFERLKEICGTRTSPEMWKAVTIEPVSIGENAGVIGAAGQVWHYR